MIPFHRIASQCSSTKRCQSRYVGFVDPDDEIEIQIMAILVPQKREKASSADR